MTKVSKYPLKKEVEDRMYEVFWRAIAKLHKPEDVQSFFHELLSPTEQLMLAKRFAISILLIKQYTYEEIIDILKTSPLTIGSIARWLKSGGKAFKKSIEILLTQEKQEEFWDNLETFLSRFIVPRHGGNWSQIKKEQFIRLKRRRQKRALI